MKTAWFDMDGTIVAPRFRTREGMRVGFPPAQWREFCRQAGFHAYADCLPVPPVVAFADELKRLGYSTRILTVTLSDEEKDAKRYWLNAHLDVRDRFDGIIFAENPADKIRIIKAEHGQDRKPGSAVLIEDDYNTLYLAMNAWIVPLHVSHILTGTALPLLDR